LDESGDTGFRIGRGSSEFFVLTLLLIDDPLPLQVAIDDLRHDLGFPRLTEFKFNKSRGPIRERFLRIIAAHELAIYAVVVNKLLLLGRPELRQIGDFYDFVARVALLWHRDALSNTLLVLDERAKSKQVQRATNAYLRHAVNTDPERPALRDIKHVPSLKNNLIQATDMAAVDASGYPGPTVVMVKAIFLAICLTGLVNGIAGATLRR
jgi:hypothetical protein